MSKLTKDTLAQKLAARMDFLTLAQARMVSAGLFEVISESLSQHQVVEVRGFGTFRVKDFGPRIRINPATREKSQVPARSAVRFRAGAQLRTLVNKKPGNTPKPEADA
jgi:nucleoid DNA-binding protein